jgi:hypothetical protein
LKATGAISSKAAFRALASPISGSRLASAASPPQCVAAAPRCGQQIGQMRCLNHHSPTTINDSEAAGALFQSPKRQNEFQGYRASPPDRAAPGLPILIGAAMIAAAILLSTLITAVGTRFAGTESPSEETLWLVDRLTGNVYKCQAPERGKASCEAEVAAGGIGERPKR